MPQTALHSLDEYRAALAAYPRVLLFKHSPICPVSHAAHGEWEAFRLAHPEVPTLFVDVIAERPVARGLAQDAGVPHASPQAILFVAGKAAWDASHSAIQRSALEGAWSRGA